MSVTKLGKLILHSFADVFTNLALEQILLQNAELTQIPIVRLWQNPPAVILGRGQTLDREIEMDFCKLHAIQIVRRISGGGCVFQDLGNWNISFMFPLSAFGRSVDILNITHKLTQIIVSVLGNMEYADLTLYKNGNILLAGKKISGSAGYKFKNWYLHHLTILADTNLDHLNRSLLARSRDPVDRRESQYYPTTNLGSFSMDRFTENLRLLVSSELGTKLADFELPESLIKEAHQLADSLYSTTEWIHRGRRKR